MPRSHDIARTALITGANRGLGLETAHQLAARGLRVLVSSREAAAAQIAAVALAKAAPPGAVVALPLPLDVADPDRIDAVAAHLRANGTTVDVLVNNAGIALDGFDANVARRTIDVNVLGPLRLAEALLPVFAPGSTIVMVWAAMLEDGTTGGFFRDGHRIDWD